MKIIFNVSDQYLTKMLGTCGDILVYLGQWGEWPMTKLRTYPP